MGQTESKQIIVCSFCKSEIVPPSNSSNYDNENNSTNSSQSIIIKLPSNTILCRRCHGFYRKPIQTSNYKRRLSLFENNNNNNITYNDNDNNNNNNNDNNVYIKHLHIAPFQDTLDMIEEKEISQQYIINTYLKPYFNQNKYLKIRSRNRIIIKNVEFKVVGCYPPIGFVDESTQFHLIDNNGEIITLKWRPIRQIHFLPTKASHSTYNKIKSKQNENENGDENGNENEIESDNNSNLLKSHLKPYLQQNDREYYINDNKEEKEECKGINNKMYRRHLMEEETFEYLGIEWRVMKCQPFDGYIDNMSTIYCHGPAIIDCNKISIRPIYESLPNAHKNYTPHQIKKYYLDPFFYGRCRYIDHSRQICIFGVDFSIRESEPAAGIITNATYIDYTAAPVKSNELLQMQHNEDMQLARQLQQEENNRIIDIHTPQLVPTHQSHPQYHQVTLADITEIFERLQAAQGPQGPQGSQPNNNNNNNPNNNPNNDPFLQFIRQLQMASQNNPRRTRNSGVNPQLIDRLPTFKYVCTYTNKEEEQQDEKEEKEDDINRSCRICLEYYENNEELRFLPCFHKYHKECVDRWFQMSSKCPICKTSITQQLRH